MFGAVFPYLSSAIDITTPMTSTPTKLYPNSAPRGPPWAIAFPEPRNKPVPIVPASAIICSQASEWQAQCLCRTPSFTEMYLELGSSKMSLITGENLTYLNVSLVKSALQVVSFLELNSLCFSNSLIVDRSRAIVHGMLLAGEAILLRIRGDWRFRHVENWTTTELCVQR